MKDLTLRMPEIKCHLALRGEKYNNYMNMSSTIYKAIHIQINHK